jgi:hypothetical protein
VCVVQGRVVLLNHPRHLLMWMVGLQVAAQHCWSLPPLLLSGRQAGGRYLAGEGGWVA